MPLQPIQRGSPSYLLYQSTLSFVLAVGFALLFGYQAQAQSSLPAGNLGDPLTTLAPATGISVAGLTVQLDNPQQRPDGSLHARRAQLGVPSALGGASVTVNDVTVKDGVVTIGGGRFDLPRIKVAGFVLGLSGSLEQDEQGAQIIKASGSFTAPNLGTATGCSGIQVSVTLEQTSDELVRLTLQPSAATVALAQVTPSGPYLGAATDGVGLREASLSLDCAIPIGATGFDLKSVSGTVTLHPDSTTIQIAATVATTRQVLGKSVVSANGSVTLTTEPFSLALETGVKLFIFDVANANAFISPREFRGTLQIELVVARGSVAVNSWVDSSDAFHLTGSGRLEVGVPKGAIYKKCRKLLFIKLGCTPIPPSNLNVGQVDVQAGEFRNGAWGFKGSVKFLKFSQGFYIDSEGNIKFGKVDGYQLVTPEDVAAAHAAWSSVTASGAEGMAAYSGYHFASTTSAFPLTVTTSITQPSELIFVLSREGAAPQLSLVMPDGTEVTPDRLPENISYTEVFTTTVEEPDEIPLTQVAYTVADAEAGDWLAVLTGEPGEGEFYSFEVIGHPDEPVVQAAEATVVSSGAGNATITWQLTAYDPEVYVAIYANPGPITRTFVINNSDGATETVELPVYEGIELAADIPAQVDNTPQSYEVNTDYLPSGIYRIWLEVDDEINDPVQVYLPEPLVVDHSSDFSETWTPTITVEAGYEDAVIKWSPHPSPDVDYYIVYIGETPGSATPEHAVDSFVVGYDEDFDLVGLDGGETLYVAIGAYDVSQEEAISANRAQSERYVLSPEVEVKTLDVEFALTPSTTALTLVTGGSANLTLNLSSTVSDFPDEIYLYEDCLFDNVAPGTNVYLPLITSGGSQASRTPSQQPIRCRESHGLVMTFDDDDVMPTEEGIAVNATIEAVNTPPGEYLVPIVGDSNNTIVSFDLHVTVTAAGATR
jgi:hypothetical protein